MFDTVRVLTAFFAARVGVARSREERDLGASALEWAIIAAVAVVMAVLIGGIIYKVVSDKGDQLKECGGKDVGPGTTC